MSRMTYRLALLLVALGLCAAGFGQTRPGPPVSVMVNEIVASNAEGAPDPQGDFDDWIELYNPGQLAADVGGCYLTDDLAEPTKWQIPAGQPAVTTIPARGFLLIWADGDVTAAGGLHAGFRLSDEGEEVGLFAADGVTLIDSLSFGEQRTDISYGRYPDGAPELRFMAFPTPGFANISVYEGIAESPQFSIGSRMCTEPVTVALTTATEDAMIFYTIDGSDPFSEPRGAPTGATYSSPITIARTMTVKAAAWLPGWRPSDVSTAQYIFAGADLMQFSSPLAIAVVDTQGRSVSNSQRPAFGYFIDVDETGRASMTGEVDFAGAAAINIRGKSSAGFPKHQYHFETQDERGEDLDVSILGLPAESDWVLQGPYSDKALMRNVLSYQWSNEMGRYAPRTRFIELFLDTGGSVVSMSDYVGVYVLMEKIKIASDRVDITKLEPSDNAEPEITGGYIIKKDKFDGDDQSFNTSRGQRLIYQEPNGRELTEAQKNWIRNFFNSFEAVLYSPSFTDPVNGYAKFIDVGSFIDNHILVELTKNIDGFRLSTYMHKDREGKLTMGPAWDYNLSLGNADYLNGWRATGWYFSQLSEGDYPYWRRLFEDPQFRLRYADRWFALRRDLFTTDRLVGMVEDYATLLDEPAARNFNRWRILGQRVWPNWYIAKTFREEILWMQGWLSDRLAWMDSQIAAEFAPAPPVFNQQGGHVDTGFALAMSAPGEIYYTLDGSDPRSLTGPVPPTTGTVLVAESAAKRVLVPAGPVDDAWRSDVEFDDSAWTPVTGSPGGVGFERSLGYESFFTLDVQTQMYGERTGCYVRIPFGFTGNTKDVQRLTLRVRYDDGFVAYINGVEVARRNFAGAPAWNSYADAINPDTSAANLESIDIPNIASVLRRGNNLLAIHAMNASETSSDFLISADLVADEAVQPETPIEVDRYSGPIVLTESARVKARALIAGRWSAISDAVFAVGPVAGSLRISELMYHPLETGDPNDPNSEYVELTNIGADAINLNFVRFTDGIDFTFPSFELTPNGYCLVVRDLGGFEAKYGVDLPVAGQYAGALSNAGERVELQDAAGRVIHGFTYDDDWFSLTDGLGPSLTLKDPVTVDPNALDDPSVWRPSTGADGSPGAAEIP